MVSDSDWKFECLEAPPPNLKDFVALLESQVVHGETNHLEPL